MSLEKLEPSWSRLVGDNLTPTHIIANDDVMVEQKAVTQLTEIASLDHTLKKLGISDAHLHEIVATPDLHVGSPFPVGVAVSASGLVIPGAVGNDIGCGMRMCVFDLVEDDLQGHWDALAKNLRHIFFSGGRDVPLSPRQREAILREGLIGLADTYADNAGHGIWNYLDLHDLEKMLARHHKGGSLISNSILFHHKKWIQSSGLKHGYDSAIAQISAGNHFHELQVVDKLHDFFAAKEYGLKEGQIAMMVHTGSNTLGHAVGGHYRDLAKKELLAHTHHATGAIPEHLYPLLNETSIANYLDHMSTAANFATVNRLTLSLMLQKALTITLGREVGMKLVWDAPHNLTWQEEDVFLHRKGATPAEGSNAEFGFAGDPVLLPGSMGDASWVLSGLGARRSLASASHGAGRALSRGRASHLKTNEIVEQKLRVVMPVDMQDLVSRGRADIAREIAKRLQEETPSAYKPVLPALTSLETAGAATRVAKMRPLLTIKEI